MARRKILAGNWKMNLGPNEALQYFTEMKRHHSSRKDSDLIREVIFVPAYDLGAETQRAALDCGISIGAQNVLWEEKGAFTGELSPTALAGLGIRWVLIGHSERRQFFGESDTTAVKRFAKAASCGHNIVYCVGESLQEREAGQTEAVLERQVSPLLPVLREALANTQGPTQVFSIAYEPVWAIGTGKTATTEQAEEAHKFIRKLIWDSLGLETASALPLLYGGSVTPENARSLLGQPNIDGVLVGGASLKPEGFSRILASV